MTVYFCELAVVFFAALIFDKSIQIHPDTKKKAYLAVVFFVLFLVSALRAVSVGTDTLAYSSGALTASRNPFSFSQMIQQKAPLYYFLIFFGSRILPPIYSYQIISSLVIELTFALFIYKNSKECFSSTWLFLMLYFYFQSLNTGRQFMAIGLVAMALSNIINNKKKNALVLILLAALIHTTAIVALPILLLGNKNKKIRSIITLGICLGIAAYPILLRLFVQIFPKYAFYLRGRFFETGRNRKIILTAFQFLFLIYSVYVLKQKRSCMDEHVIHEFQILQQMSLIGVVIGVLALRSMMITRLEYYYSISFMLLVPLTIQYSGRNRKLILFGILAIMAIPGLVLLYGGNGGILPYRFFWS